MLPLAGLSTSFLVSRLIRFDCSAGRGVWPQWCQRCHCCGAAAAQTAVQNWEPLVPDVEAVTPTSDPNVRIRGTSTRRLNPDTVWGKVLCPVRCPSSPARLQRFGGIVSQRAWRPCGSSAGAGLAALIGCIREGVHAATPGLPWPRPSKHRHCITLSRPAGCRNISTTLSALRREIRER